MAVSRINEAGLNVNQYGNRNLIINGAMQVAQRGTSATTNGYGSVDRFTTAFGGTDESPTQAQVDVASGTTPYTLGFRKALKITNGNQTSGAGAADYLAIYNKIEGQDISSSGWNVTDPDSKLTLSYWVKSSVAQTFYGRFRAYASSEYEYTYSFALSANTWTKVTKTIIGNSNFSSLVNTNAVGFQHVWQCFFGTDYTNNKTLDAWAVKDNANKSPDMTSTWYTTNDATFEITGVQLEVGDTATDFEHRTFGDELQRCSRYYQKTKAASDTTKLFGLVYIGADAGGVSYGTLAVPLVTTMRTVPSLETTGTLSNYALFVKNAATALNTFSVDTGVDDGTIHGQFYLNAFATVSAGAGSCGAVRANGTADAYVALDAEL